MIRNAWAVRLRSSSSSTSQNISECRCWNTTTGYFCGYWSRNDHPCIKTHQTHPILHKLWAGVENSEALAVVGLCRYSTLLLSLVCRSWFGLSSCWFGAVVTFLRNSHISDCRCCLSPYRLHLLFFFGAGARATVGIGGIVYALLHRSGIWLGELLGFSLFNHDLFHQRICI